MASGRSGSTSSSGATVSNSGIFSRERLSRAIATASTGLQQTIATAASAESNANTNAPRYSVDHTHSTSSSRAYISSVPQEFVKVPRSSFERVKFWYRADLSNLVDSNASDKETLLAENDALRSALSQRLYRHESVESVLPDNGTSVERVRETDDGVNRVLLCSAAHELEQQRSRVQELENQLSTTQAELRDLRMRQVSRTDVSDTGAPAISDGDEDDKASSNSGGGLPVSHEAMSTASASSAQTLRLQEQVERMQQQLQEKEKSNQELKQKEKSLRSKLDEQSERADHAERAYAELQQQLEHYQAQLEHEREENANNAWLYAQTWNEGDSHEDRHQGKKETPASSARVLTEDENDREANSYHVPSTRGADGEQPEEHCTENKQIHGRRRTPSEVEVEEALEHAERLRQRNEELEGELHSTRQLLAEKEDLLKKEGDEKERLLAELDTYSNPQEVQNHQASNDLTLAKQVVSEVLGEEVSAANATDLLEQLVSSFRDQVSAVRQKVSDRMAEANSKLQQLEDANEQESQHTRHTIRAVCEHALNQLERSEEQVKDAQWQAAQLEGAADERDKAREAAEQVRAAAERANELGRKADHMEHELESERKRRVAETERLQVEIEKERESARDLQRQLQEAREAEEAARAEASRQAESSASSVQSEATKLQDQYESQLQELTQQQSEAREEAERWKQRYESMRDDFTKWRDRALSMMESKDNELASLKQKQQQQHASALSRVQRADGYLDDDGPAAAKAPHPSARFDGQDSEADEAPIKRVDWVYLQNVVAKFAATLDAGTQESLLPVIGTLLALDQSTMDSINASRKQHGIRWSNSSTAANGGNTLFSFMSWR